MKLTVIVAISLVLLSCTQVLKKELLESAVRDVPFSALAADPSKYTGELFILGGIIVDSKATKEGSLVEAIYVDVDKRGNLEDVLPSTRRFMALLPKNAGFLDPLIYKRNRKVTIAGTLTGSRVGKIDDMDYRFPLFRIEEIYLWPKEEPRYAPYPYWPDPFYSPWWYDPYWRYRRYDPWYPYPYW